MNEKFMELPARIRTRMTLTLLENVEFERVLRDFQNVPDTLLLFLRKLQDLTIEIHPSDDEETSITYSKNEYQQSGLHVADLEKLTQVDALRPNSQQKFYMVKREVEKLLYDPARVERNGKSIDHATTNRGRLEFRADTWAVTPKGHSFEPLGEPEDRSLSQQRSSIETPLTAQEHNNAISSSSTQSTRTPAAAVTTLPDRTSEFVVGGKNVVVRLPQSSGPSPSLGLNTLTPPNSSDSSSAGQRGAHFGQATP